MGNNNNYNGNNTEKMNNKNNDFNVNLLNDNFEKDIQKGVNSSDQELMGNNNNYNGNNTEKMNNKNNDFDVNLLSNNFEKDNQEHQKLMLDNENLDKSYSTDSKERSDLKLIELNSYYFCFTFLMPYTTTVVEFTMQCTAYQYINIA